MAFVGIFFIRGLECKTVSKCFFALILVTFWLVSQNIQFTFIPVYSNLTLSVTFNDGGFILIAAMWLVLNNTVRVNLLYSGWFLFSDGLSDIFDSKRIAWVLPPIAITFSYFGISLLHFPSVPHFGVPALFAIISVWLLQYITRDVKRAGYKIAVQAAVVFSIQWLDLIPVLTPYGFGWGELSVAVKEASKLMEKDHLLDMVCGLAFAFSSLASLLLTKLFVSYEKQLRQLHLLRQRERELTRIRTNQLRMRLYQEMQYLVHDLKRPLTTVLGLADLLSLSPDQATSNHGLAIMSAAEKLDQMIGEIKDPERVREASVKEVVDYAMAQVRALSWGSIVTIVIEDGALEKGLMLNVIRFSRVLVNLLENARHATEGLDVPLVSLRVCAERDDIFFVIEDNGAGFIETGPGENSGWGSTGLGIAFVRKALEGFSGVLKYEEREGGGVVCTVSLPAIERSRQ
ncbi:MAG: HAMP domain-containing sensor histidine kinase [Synergistaceae bacterium]|nr:HAMP domain-containing sensor histidine kinase [Synergistaceae bacterium]